MFTKAARMTAKDSPTTLERVGNGDETAVTECVRTHGDWIWGFAKANSDSEEAAEQLTMKIFEDIWKFAHRFKPSGLREDTFLGLIVRRRLRGKATPNKMDITRDNKFYKSFQSYAKNGEK